MMRNRLLQLVTWLFSRLVPKSEREPLVGDLMEEYELRAKTSSSSSAFTWYLQQVCASAASLLWARLRRSVWIATFGVAFLAYIAVGVVDFAVKSAIPNRTADGAFAPNPLGLIVTFPMVVLIGYVAARFQPRAPVVLGVTMLLLVAVMMMQTDEIIPLWYRIAYFFVGSAAFIGGALRSLQSRRYR